MKRLPAQTSTSLLAKATMRPARTAARVGASPAAPTMPAITQSAGRSAASTTASGPHADLDPGAGQRLLQRGIFRRVGDRGEARVRAPRLLGQQRRVAVRGQRLDGELVAVAQQQIDRAAADRAGRAEDRDPARPRRRDCCALASAVTAMSARCRRRSRSAAPPPGSRPAGRRAGQAGRHGRE